MTDFIYQIADRYVTEDVIPCLGDNGIDLPTYRDVVLKRFTNPHIQDTNQRVAADGFSKIPAMIAPTLRVLPARRSPECHRHVTCTVLRIHGAMASRQTAL